MISDSKLVAVTKTSTRAEDVPMVEISRERSVPRTTELTTGNVSYS